MKPLSPRCAPALCSPLASLWLLRHALPVPDSVTAQQHPDTPVHAFCYGQTDWPAHPDHTQAAAQAMVQVLRAHAAAHQGRLPLLRHSPLSRCKQLAHAIQAEMPEMTLKVDARIAEMHFGEWEGRRWDSLSSAAFDGWMADFAHHRVGRTGETVAQLVDRVAQTAREALTPPASLGPNAATEAPLPVTELWVTHAGVIKSLHWLGQHAPHRLRPPATAEAGQPTAEPADESNGQAAMDWASKLSASSWPQDKLRYGSWTVWPADPTN